MTSVWGGRVAAIDDHMLVNCHLPKPLVGRSSSVESPYIRIAVVLVLCLMTNVSKFTQFMISVLNHIRKNTQKQFVSLFELGTFTFLSKT